MATESGTKNELEKIAKKKQIAIVEPAGYTRRKEEKRKSFFPDPRGSQDMQDSSNSTEKKQSVAQVYDRLMNAGFPSVAPRRWTSQRSTLYKSPRFQNTYLLESRRPFDRDEVEPIVHHYLDSFLQNLKYYPKRAKRLAENLSIDLRDTIKRCRYDRYRTVVWVTVGDKFHQDFRATMHFLWDAEKDGYITYAFETPDFFVNVVIFGIYYE
ncbi:dynein light chain Tctex-type protein 2B-like [Toxorhynchites rutilus septentrionalis]|uniref:dynein light chain Tctex-type protein 2B-like n=1 Tax=Toxorhynchites rutilus septentrionalis TaxID=329112 RepID=UPI0024799CE1|nr:dynein light chain Tctex-type protein 2B-like [Toxorhynchites rutilus septentrionalis]XP_055629924.1 dynein light chain Tctex-type protein 2B-like [Toxorhynchites rutilus septentrionalis]XP_055629925.1 dynein light chain Tctex-type protein 2B-like [Toxorhynchites rutilus septentrionalis]